MHLGVRRASCVQGGANGALGSGALLDQLYRGVPGRVGEGAMPRRPKPLNPFRWFDSSPEVIRYAVMLYVFGTRCRCGT